MVTKKFPLFKSVNTLSWNDSTALYKSNFMMNICKAKAQNLWNNGAVVLLQLLLSIQLLQNFESIQLFLKLLNDVTIFVSRSKFEKALRNAFIRTKQC